MVPLAPFPDSPFAPLPDMIAGCAATVGGCVTCRREYQEAAVRRVACVCALGCKPLSNVPLPDSLRTATSVLSLARGTLARPRDHPAMPKARCCATCHVMKEQKEVVDCR